eukprot:766325-Hanusia_phi.AAC.1
MTWRSFQEVCYLLSTADPGVFVVRYSTAPGNFAIQWCSAGRQIKSAKVEQAGGPEGVLLTQHRCSSRQEDTRGESTARASIPPCRRCYTRCCLRRPQPPPEPAQVHSFLSYPLVLPPQRESAKIQPLGPDDD